MVAESIRAKVREILSPLARPFIRLHPNTLTLIGFIIICVASVWYARGIFWLGGIILLVGGLFDILDGEVAKITGKISVFGAFLDSCLDRYSDFIVLFGIFWWYFSRDTVHRAPIILVLLAIFGAYIVSYTRARAEGLGRKCRVGLGERAFRIPVIAIGSLFGPRIFVGFLLLLVIITNVTGIYRIWWMWRKL